MPEAKPKRKRRMTVEDTVASVLLPEDGEVRSGVDIVEIARMRRVLERTPVFARRVFSAEEASYCEAQSQPESAFALRFAAKSAVLKALGTGYEDGVGVRDVEVRRNAKGRPSVVLRGKARQVAQELGVVDLPLSLSYTHTDAVACALAITKESVRAVEERTDPMEELARRFKEARSLLDEDVRASGDAGFSTAEARAFLNAGREDS